jgi:hypothetical protein
VNHLLVENISGNIFTGNLLKMSKQEKSREFMFSKIRAWQESGLSQKVFCEQYDVSYSNFHYWYKRFREVDLSPSPGFASLQIRDMGNSIFASVMFSNGSSVQLHQTVRPEYIKELLS